MSSQNRPRTYRLGERAKAMEETRRRIAKAAFDLHAMIGPARTTIAAIAERAGVERATVYKHFPNDLALFRGCVGHGMAANPPPDPAGWAAIADAEERLRTGLTALYAFYRDTKNIWTNILRDMPAMPAFRQANAEAGLFDYFDQVGDLLSDPWRATGRRRAMVRAAVGHAIDFPTWQSLTGPHGLSDRQAVEAMTVMVRGLAG